LECKYKGTFINFRNLFLEKKKNFFKIVGAPPSTIPSHQQRQDYYRDVNQSLPRQPQNPMSPTFYHETPDPRTGLNSCIK